MKVSIGTMIALVLSVMTFSSCKKVDLAKEAPNCIERKIRKIMAKDVWNPPASVWEWKVDGKTYYYITSDCCDQFNYLYDDKCNEVCAPDGGFTGTGDGNCPPFNGPVESTLLWEDDRG